MVLLPISPIVVLPRQRPHSAARHPPARISGSREVVGVGRPPRVHNPCWCWCTSRAMERCGRRDGLGRMREVRPRGWCVSSGLTRSEITEAARLFPEALPTRQLLEGTGIPTSDLPWSPFFPRIFWTALSEQLEHGIAVAGRERLLATLRVRYPANPVFGDGGGAQLTSIPTPDTRQGTEPAVHTALSNRAPGGSSESSPAPWPTATAPAGGSSPGRTSAFDEAGSPAPPALPEARPSTPPDRPEPRTVQAETGPKTATEPTHTEAQSTAPEPTPSEQQAAQGTAQSTPRREAATDTPRKRTTEGRPAALLTRRNLLFLAAPVTVGAVVSAVAFIDRGDSEVKTAGIDVWRGPVHGARALAPPLHGHRDTVFSVAFSSDGTTLASGSADRTVRLWDMHHPTAPSMIGLPLAEHTAEVTSVAFAAHRSLLAGGGYDGAAVLWDVTTPKAPKLLDEPDQPLTDPANPLNAVVFSPDGTILATAGNDLSIRLWDVTHPSAPRLLGQQLTGHDDVIRALAFSPDGKTLVSAADDHTVRLWNLDDLNHPQPFDTAPLAHGNAVWTVAYSPHGHILASGGDDRALRLWNVTDPTAPQLIGSPLTGHTDNRISALAFSPAGTTLAEGGNDSKVRLWDVTHPNTPRQLGLLPPPGHRDSVWSVAFSPDGRILASASGDATIGLWALT